MSIQFTPPHIQLTYDPTPTGYLWVDGKPIYRKILDWTSDTEKFGGDQWNIPLGIRIKDVISYDGMFWSTISSGVAYRKFNQPPNRNTINTVLYYIEPEDTEYDNPNTCFCLMTDNYTGSLSAVRLIIFYTRMEDYE